MRSDLNKSKLALTVRQREALEFIRKYIRERGFGPTVREVAKGLGIHSPNGAKSHLDALERKGFICREANLSRSIMLTNSSRFSKASCPVFALLEDGFLRSNPDSEEIFDLEEKLKINEREFCCVRVLNDCFWSEFQFKRGDFLLIRRSRNAAGGETVILNGPENGFMLAKSLFDEKQNKIILKTTTETLQDSSSLILGILVSLIRFEL